MKLPNFQSLTTFAWFFFFFGIVFGGVGLLTFAHKLNFLSRALPTQGEVIAVEAQTDGEESLYSLKVRFFDQHGVRQVFSPRLKSNPPRYHPGQVVDIYFDQTDPAHGEINSFLDMWLFESIFGGMGAISLVIASAFLVRDIHKKRQRAWLLSFGVKIKAKFDSISQGNVVINGKTANLIVCQYLDPKDKLLYIYHSDYIWFNPKPHLPKSGDIDVWIDPNNPAKYWVDLSFLPQTAANA